MKRLRFLLVPLLLMLSIGISSARVDRIIEQGVRIGTGGLGIGAKANLWSKCEISGTSGAITSLGNFAIKLNSSTNKFTVAAATGNTVIVGTLAVTGASTLTGATGVVGNFAVNTNKFTVAAASGNTLAAGTLSSTGDLAVNTNKFVVTAASGNTAIAGTANVVGDFTVNTNKLIVTAASGNTTIAGTLGVTGAATIPVRGTRLDTTATPNITAADYGKIVMLSYAGAIAITLPANGAAAGSTLDIMIIGADTCIPTISAATADTLIAMNDAAADSVTFATGHRIGAYVRFISTGTYWVAINLGNTTMTITT